MYVFQELLANRLVFVCLYKCMDTSKGRDNIAITRTQTLAYARIHM